MSSTIDETRRRPPFLWLDGGFDKDPPSDRKDFRRRLAFTLGALVVYRMGRYFPIPGIDLVTLDRLGHIQFFAGGIRIPDVSMFSLGIMPYISAFIIVLLVGRIFPRLGGSAASVTDRARLVRGLTIVLATFEAFGVALNLQSIAGAVILPGYIFTAMTVVGLVAGAMFVTWLAHQITSRGIGEGALLILACSIVSKLPFDLGAAFDAVRVGDVDIASLLGALLMVAVLFAVIAFVERSERRIPLYDPGYEVGQGAHRGYQDISLRINPAGVLPALAATIFVAPLLQSITAVDWLTAVIVRFLGGGGFDLVYGALLVLFAAYFNAAILNRDRMAGRPTGRPDDDTSDSSVRYMRSLHVALGACYVMVVCLLPLLIYRWTVWPFVLSGFQIFLLGWVMTRILERVRASQQA
jgi:preprotein translocase subunit SecY